MLQQFIDIIKEHPLLSASLAFLFYKIFKKTIITLIIVAVLAIFGAHYLQALK